MCRKLSVTCITSLSFAFFVSVEIHQDDNKTLCIFSFLTRHTVEPNTTVMPCLWCILEGNIKQFSEAYDARQLLYYWAKKKIAPVGAVWKGHASSALVNDVLMDQIFFLLISYWVTTARHAIQHVPDPSSPCLLVCFSFIFLFFNRKNPPKMKENDALTEWPQNRQYLLYF